MKASLISVLILFGSSLTVARAEISGSHGGDPCEDMFQTHSRNLRVWLTSKAAQKLILKDGTEYYDFSRKMLHYLAPYVDRPASSEISFSCVDEPIFVEHEEKTCAWRSPEEDPTITDGKIHIDCNFNRFYGNGKTEEQSKFQLKQTIHEWASIAGIERNEGSISDYAFTDQITAQGHWSYQFQLGLDSDFGSSAINGIIYESSANRKDGSLVFSGIHFNYGERILPIAFEGPHSYDAVCKALGYAMGIDGFASMFSKADAIQLSKDGQAVGIGFHQTNVTEAVCVK